MMRRLYPILAAVILAGVSAPALQGRPQAQPPAATIDTTRVRDTVDGVGGLIQREYFDPALGARINRTLHARLESGAYDSAPTPDALARLLTRDLFAIARDKHLAVTVIRPSAPQPATAAAADARREAARRDNGGIRRVEILAGNVGYLDIRSFWRLDEAREALDAAMHLLERADALVIDLRNNGGGSPDTVALLASYLIDNAPTPLFEITPRSGPPVRYSTSPVSTHDGRRPVFVLTSPRSFSGGEGFAFLLQDLKRAEVIGERTAGAANPGRPYPVNDLFEVVVPNGRLLTVPSARNWEGDGVTPDVPVSSEDALRIAHERALRRLLEAATSEPDRQRLTAALTSATAAAPR
jgi:C-terminal processing protease CtpA/Prc